MALSHVSVYWWEQQQEYIGDQASCSGKKVQWAVPVKETSANHFCDMGITMFCPAQFLLSFCPFLSSHLIKVVHYGLQKKLFYAQVNQDYTKNPK